MLSYSGPDRRATLFEARAVVDVEDLILALRMTHVRRAGTDLLRPRMNARMARNAVAPLINLLSPLPLSAAVNLLDRANSRLLPRSRRAFIFVICVTTDYLSSFSRRFIK